MGAEGIIELPLNKIVTWNQESKRGLNKEKAHQENDEAQVPEGFVPVEKENETDENPIFTDGKNPYAEQETTDAWHQLSGKIHRVDSIHWIITFINKENSPSVNTDGLFY